MTASDKILQQAEAIRRSGKTNMLDLDTVQLIAYESDFHALVTWIEDHNHKEYTEMMNMAHDLGYWKVDELSLLDNEVPDTIVVEEEL